MKQIITLVCLLSIISLSLSAATSATACSAISPVAATTSATAQTFTLTITANSLSSTSATPDKAYFGATTTPSAIIGPVTVASATAVSGTVSLTANTVGVYNLFIQANGENLGVNQTSISGVAITNAISATTLSAINVTSTKINTATPLKFTMVASTIYNTDKIVFSTSTSPASTDPSITVSGLTSTTFAGTSFETSVTITTAGKYNVFITRGTTTTQQTSISLTVGAAKLVSSFFVLLLGLLLL